MCIDGQACVAEFFAAHAVEVAINDAVAFVQMTTFEQHRACAHVDQCRCRIFGVIGIGDAATEQEFGFRRVGGEQGGQWQQAFAHSAQCAVFQQFGAAGGDHHRVKHDMRRATLLEHVGDEVDHLGIGKHAQFHCMDVEVVEAGFDLRLQEGHRRYMDGGDAARVLRGECRDGGQAVHAVRGECLEVRLDAGAAAGVGAGDGEGGNGGGRGHAGIVQCLPMALLTVGAGAAIAGKSRSPTRPGR
ncbi:hypothetical protein D3C81_1192210 [compost metagenome]